MNTIKFHLLHPDAQLPKRATAHAAAYDVVAVSREIKDGYVSYGLGFSTELPAGWQAKCYARSSVSNTDLILCNGVGIIDADYRGEWSYRFRYAPSFEDGLVERFNKQDEGQMWFDAGRLITEHECVPARIYEVGDRIGQIQFERVPELRFEVVEELSTTERGAGGYGSTGNQ